jgi:sulfatase modifying factor 1
MWLGIAAIACSAPQSPSASARPADSVGVLGPFRSPALMVTQSSPEAALALPSSPPPSAQPLTASAPEIDASNAELAPRASCPERMQHVRASFCPELERECLHKEYDAPNRITICHEFRQVDSACQAPRLALDYCIDRYEYPNRPGGKPSVMLNFQELEAACAAVGKRLCRESEWVAACEGPAETPFPYGFRRDPEKCNFDNKWVTPILAKVYSKDSQVQAAELRRLDRSLPSGSRPECRSGYEVFDLTGNVDEWVRAEPGTERRSGGAALKGGAWGHVRNACRPATTSHAPSFEYYFIGGRCCADTRP